MAVKELVVGGGCFWCTEAVFSEVKGVHTLQSGYANGETPNPTYRDICSGTTGYAEVVKITYDDTIITRNTLLTIFFATHNPTTLNYQGNDHGTQYRSTILYSDVATKEAAETVMATTQSNWSDPIVTLIEPLKNYYPAESYHQDYFSKNPTQGYCLATIPPKLKKLQTKFAKELKK
jgi:methionine-S-sulfoxide reductase